MPKRLNPDHIAQILHSLSGSPHGHTHEYHQQPPKGEQLTAEGIKKKTPSLNNSERARLLEVLRFNGLVHHADGHSMKKFKPLAQTYPDSRIIWSFEITERGQTYLTTYDLFQETLSLIAIPGTVPEELDWEIIPDSIRPAPGRPLKRKHSEDSSMPGLAVNVSRKPLTQQELPKSAA
jgi:hypothetical protein